MQARENRCLSSVQLLLRVRTCDTRSRYVFVNPRNVTASAERTVSACRRRHFHPVPIRHADKRARVDLRFEVHGERVGFGLRLNVPLSLDIERKPIPRAAPRLI